MPRPSTVSTGCSAAERGRGVALAASAVNRGTRVRTISEDERGAWCSCTIPADDPAFEDRIAAEWSWLARWHPTTRNVFALVDADDRFLGRYDVPFESPDGWRLWAPSVHPDVGSRGLAALCRHVVAASAARGMPRVEVILEGTHRQFGLARDALSAVGFRMIEAKVISERDLSAPLPEPASAGLRFVPAATLPAGRFAQLCAEAGMTEEEVREVPLDAPEASRWIVALRGDEAVGVALLESIDAEAGIVTCRHVGVRAPRRGRGYGRALLARALQSARDAGAKRYLDSTERANGPMRALFGSAGFVDLGERLVFELRMPPGKTPG